MPPRPRQPGVVEGSCLNVDEGIVRYIASAMPDAQEQWGLQEQEASVYSEVACLKIRNGCGFACGVLSDVRALI